MWIPIMKSIGMLYMEVESLCNYSQLYLEKEVFTSQGHEQSEVGPLSMGPIATTGPPPMVHTPLYLMYNQI